MVEEQLSTQYKLKNFQLKSDSNIYQNLDNLVEERLKYHKHGRGAAGRAGGNTSD